jgi:Family of unknown function (DUF6221)
MAGVPPLVVGRLLREVEAKRRIMDEAHFVWSTGGDDVLSAGWNILCRLAAVYADHADYQSEWEPEA